MATMVPIRIKFINPADYVGLTSYGYEFEPGNVITFVSLVEFAECVVCVKEIIANRAGHSTPAEYWNLRFQKECVEDGILTVYLI